MNRQLSDEQLDRIAKSLIGDFSMDDETLDEIAGSPQLWWGVKNQIAAEKERREKSRFGLFRPRLLALAAFAGVICFGLAILYVNFANTANSGLALQNPSPVPVREIAETPVDISSENAPNIPPKTVSNPSAGKVSTKNAVPKTSFVAKVRATENRPKPVREISPVTAVEETKTDFIALSYAANTDSGQIVRVKVPSSMMVSLGVRETVEKESELVNAEVVIGDDGLARAIRFIR